MKALLFGAIVVSMGMSCLSRQTEYAPLDPTSCKVDTPDRVISFDIDVHFSSYEENMIIESMLMWTKSTGGRVKFAHEPPWLGSTPELYFTLAYSKKDLPPHSEERAIGLYRPGQIWLVTSELRTEQEFKAVAAHEIGHHLDIYSPRIHASYTEDGPITCMSPRVWGECLDGDVLPEKDRQQFCVHYHCSCSK